MIDINFKKGTSMIEAKYGNDFVADLDEEAKKEMIEKCEYHLREALKCMLIDVDNDHNTKDTPRRIAKMWVTEKMKGRFSTAPKITFFPNVKELDQMIVIDNIDVKSMCSHHFVDFTGKCHIGILPDPKGNLCGLSKYARIVDWFSRRPQIQEELTQQIHDYLQENMKPKGVCVLISAKHNCCTNRGVENSNMNFLTHAISGAFKTDPHAKSEFLSLLSMRNIKL